MSDNFKQAACFWERDILPIMEELNAGNCRFPLIQNLYDDNLHLMAAVYGNGMRYFNVKPKLQIMKSSPESKKISLFGAEVRQKTERFFWLFKRSVRAPCIVVNVEAIRNWFLEESRFRLDVRFLFECFVITGHMHEMDHLALNMAEAITLEKRIDCECAAWARTCSNTIRTLIECYGQLLPPFIMNTYNAWLAMGDLKEEWREYIIKHNVS